ncbi:MAG: DUF2142 domain-containing protein [Clostridia bacterium]|nr:DUF2142 domain-containing protein [Clostridia bacterium]
MKEKKTLIIRIVLCAAFLCVAGWLTWDFYELIQPMSPYGYDDLNLESKTHLVALTSGEDLTQSLRLEEDTKGVSLLVNAVQKGSDGCFVHIQVEGNTTGNVLAAKTSPAIDFVAMDYVDLIFDRAPSEEDTLYTIRVTAVSGQPLVTFRATEDDTLEGEMTSGEQKLQGDLMVRRIVERPDRYRLVWGVYLALFFVMAALAVWLIFFTPKLHVLYASFALALGLLYMIIMVPYSVPDELVHYRASYSLSSIMMLRGDQADVGNPAYFSHASFNREYPMGKGYDRIVQEIGQPLPQQEEVAQGFPVDLAFPLMYLPQAIGVTIARLCGANYLTLFYIGRLCNLLFFICCVSLAIYCTTRFKLLFVLSGLMPMILHQAASFSYDGYVNGMGFLLIALFLRTIDRPGKITLKEIISLAVVGMLFSPSKPVYLPMFLLLLLIPKERFDTTWKKYLCVGILWILAAGAIVIFQLGSILSYANRGIDTPEIVESSTYTVSYILSHIPHVVEVFIKSLRISLTRWIREAVGTSLAWLNVAISPWKILLYILIMMAAACKAERHGIQEVVSVKERVVFFVAFAGVLFLVMLSMLLGWTPVYADMIQGVQGRYLIPAIPLLFMCVNTKYIRASDEIQTPLLLASAFVHAMVIREILHVSVML